MIQSAIHEKTFNKRQSTNRNRIQRWKRGVTLGLTIKMVQEGCEENEELKLLFRQLEVVPLTTEQNTPVWFLL